MSLTLNRRYNVDRFGYLIPTRHGNVPMVGAVATYRPGEGRFGGAVAVEEGTTNLYGNPFFKNGTDGWRSYNWGGGGKIYVEAMETPVGNSAMIMDNEGATAYLTLIQSVALPDAVSNYTVSLLVKNLSSQPCTVQLYMGRSYYTIGTVNPGDGWVRLTRTYVAGEYTQSSDHHFRIAAGQKIAIAAIQLEQKPFPTSFVDGTRAAGRIMYPPELINVQEGTFSAWVYVGDGLLQSHAYIFAFHDGTSILLLLQRNPSGILEARVGGRTIGFIGFSSLPQGWHHFALTWTTNQAVIYVDGEQLTVSSLSEPLPVPVNPRLTIGAHPTINNRSLNSMIDELLILPYAASEEEIRAWYEADGPIPPHPDALLQWDWQAVRPATMVAL